MDPFQVKQLTNATESQIQEIAEFTAEAFYATKDIAAKAFIGGDWSLLRGYLKAMIRATLLEGLLYVVTVGKGSEEKIVSMGCWFGNGTALFATEAQRALGYNAHFEKLNEETKHWLTKTYPEEMVKLDKNHFTKEEIAKRWWCFMLATHPQHEGKGYGTAIVDVMYKKAKTEKSFIGLATATDLNVKKYLSMGFKYRDGDLIAAPTGDFFLHLFSKGSLA